MASKIQVKNAGQTSGPEAVVAEYPLTAKGLVAAVAELNKSHRAIVAANGAVGAGRTWLEVGGVNIQRDYLVDIQTAASSKEALAEARRVLDAVSSGAYTDWLVLSRLDGGHPEPSDICSWRESKGLTQTAAANLVHSKLRTWQDWEAGIAKMHLGLWELFLRKTVSL